MDNENRKDGRIKAAQLILALAEDADGNPYYSGEIDGEWGTLSIAAAKRLLEALVPAQAPAPDPDQTQTMPDNAVLVFSLAEDGERYVSEHSQVKEYACNDGSDVVLIHPKLPDLFELAREKVGAFNPRRDGSAYRTVSYNATLPGASKFSMHCWGFAMDIPKGDSTPEELYAYFDPIVGENGGLGIYDWGIHVDWRGEKARWDSRGM